MDLTKYFMAIFFIAAISGEKKTEAQESGPSPELERMRSGIVKLYTLNDSLFNVQDYLINGKLFSPEGDLINHPYFIANEWNSGKIWFSGRVVGMDLLKLDICSDNLINLFKFDTYAFPVALNRENVREFVIGNHHFRYDSVFQVNGQLKAGYCEVLYEGRTCLYLRHEKSKSQNRFTFETEYPLRVTLYLKRAAKYFRINNQNDFIKSFGDQENEVRLFMKKNRIRFNAKNYDSIIKVLEYFDKLNLI